MDSTKKNTKKCTFRQGLPKHRKVMAGLVAIGALTFNAHSQAEAETKVSHALFTQVESHILDNGLHVIMAPRTTSDSVMLQLVVDVGLQDFPCDKQQIPHVIEHLVFESNTRYSPEELRNKSRDLGGFSNGWTTEENTQISVSIHSDHEREAIETLMTMIQDLRWDARDLERVKRIVDNELETPVSPIQRWFDNKRSVVELAKARLLPGTTLDCELRSSAESLNIDEIKAAYDAYYHAGNMTLIIVGNLSDTSLQWVKEQFGNLSTQATRGSLPRFKPTDTPPNTELLIEKGGFGSANAWVNLLTGMPGTNDQDFPVAELITEYLNERLFAEVRLKYGLGYTPNATIIAGSDMSYLLASTKTRSDFIDLAQQVFEKVYQDLRNEQLTDADLQRMKRKLVLKFEARERDALDVAELYRLHRVVIRNTGHMPNMIEAYTQVKADDVKRVISRYLPEKPVIALLRPPTPMEASIAVTGAIFGAAVLGWPLNLWIQRRRLQQMKKGP